MPKVPNDEKSSALRVEHMRKKTLIFVIRMKDEPAGLPRVRALKASETLLCDLAPVVENATRDSFGSLQPTET